MMDSHPQGLPEGGPRLCPPPPPLVLLALHLTSDLAEGIAQDGVLLLQASQLRVRAILQLLLQGVDLGRDQQALMPPLPAPQLSPEEPTPWARGTGKEATARCLLMLTAPAAAASREDAPTSLF